MLKGNYSNWMFGGVYMSVTMEFQIMTGASPGLLIYLPQFSVNKPYDIFRILFSCLNRTPNSQIKRNTRSSYNIPG